MFEAAARRAARRHERDDLWRAEGSADLRVELAEKSRGILTPRTMWSDTR